MRMLLASIDSTIIKLCVAAQPPLEVIVSHCDPVVNLYDQMYAIRNDRVEAVWRIAARGMST